MLLTKEPTKRLILIISTLLLRICIFSPRNISSFVVDLHVNKLSSCQQNSILRTRNNICFKGTKLNHSLENDYDKQQNSDSPGHFVEVTYQNRKSKIFVQKDESILSALENAGISKTLCLSTLPFECRKGNCLTCVGKIIQDPEETSNMKYLVTQEDGLEPNLSEEIKNSGYVLTCSTFVNGDGLKLELGLKDEVWDYVYRGRIMESEQIRRDAFASAITSYNVLNVPLWIEQTEKLLDDANE